MHTFPLNDYPQGSRLRVLAPQPANAQDRRQHRDRIFQELKALGVTGHGLRKKSVRYLPHILHPDEHVGGVVYGRSKNGAAVLAATDRRVVFLDAKPFFVSEDEVTYDVVSGISYGRSSFWSTVTLHTRVEDYTIRTYNRHCSEGFIAFIESRCLEHRMRDKGGMT